MTLIVIFVVFTLFFMFTDRIDVSPQVQKPATDSFLLVGDNAIYAVDQKPGLAVRINAALFAKTGFVVIHEDNNGKPGAIIGSSNFLSVGNNTNFIINLFRESINGENLFAMLHNDNGDNKFNAANDPPVKDDTGNVIMMKFSISTLSDDIGGTTGEVSF